MIKLLLLFSFFSFLFASDICRENEVKGFPTFIIFSDGITQEYKGGRTKGEFYSFMQGLKTLNSDQAKEEL